MTNTQPQIGRIAIVQYGPGPTTIGYAQGYTAKESEKNVIEYCLGGTGSDWPAVGFAGNKTYEIDIDALYVDNTYHNLIEQNAQINVVLGPVGSSGGNPKITVPCLIKSVNDTVAQGKVTVYKLSLESVGAPTNGTW